MYKVLIADKLSKQAEKIFNDNGISVKTKIGLNESDLINELKDCDALIINTEWSEYKQPDFNRIKNLLKSPVIFDGRNLYNKQKMKDIGFYYSNIGFQPENEQF